MITPTQKATIEAIINIYETDQVKGDYSNITLIPGDTGHLTYGRSQTTLTSGNLYKLVKAYCAAPSARFGETLRPYLDRLRALDTRLDNDSGLKMTLARAGAEDPVMRTVQDAFFDEVYWQPAVAAADRTGIETALGLATVYDGFIQGSWSAMAIRSSNIGQIGKVGEHTWVRNYVAQRREWLANNSNPVLHPTVYRMDGFLQILKLDNWDLILPLSVRGHSITTETMGIASAYTLCLNGKPLGEAWMNPADSFRNYYPVRALLNLIYGKQRVLDSLQMGQTTGRLYWDGIAVEVPFLVRGEGTAWGQVRALAGWLGLNVEHDDASRRLNLSRPAQ